MIPKEEVSVTAEDVCDRCGAMAQVFAYEEYLCSRCLSRGPLEGVERRLKALQNHLFEGTPIVYEVVYAHNIHL
jgi:hypothetical protein